MQDLAELPSTIAASQPDQKRLSIRQMMAKSFAVQAMLIFISVMVLIAYQVFYPTRPEQTLLDKLLLIGALSLATTLAFLGSQFLLSFYHVARYQTPKSALVAIFKHGWQSVAEPRRAILGVPLLIILIIFTHAYVQIKDGIPLVVPYSWDKAFHDFDVWMHFGKAPWEWLHPFFSQSPYLVFALNLNYNFWFFTMWMVIAPFAFATSNTVIRTRFFLSFFLIWAVGGGVLATWLSSVGPAFYGKLGLSPDPYAELMVYLDQVNQVVPIWAYELQNEMWRAYKGGGLNVGISAMPSMHNATALLFVIGCWHLSKKTAILLGLHCFAIYIGSIYLAWHYAIDAYLGWLITIVAWWVSGPIARWWHKQPFIARFDRELAALGANNTEN